MWICKNFGAVCRMIKIEHSVFALPFAYAGAFLAKGGWPGIELLFTLTCAMVGIRSFAMALNRVVDLPYDAKNPRTSQRPLVTGEITPWQTWQFCGIMVVLFVISCAALNPLCLAISPIPLALVVLYSYSKRFTWLCHYILGTILALAPIAGWLSVSPEFALPPFLLACAIVFWVGGFDILYACQDAAFDAQAGLYSIPARFGIEKALLISSFSHINAVLFLILTGIACGLSFGWYFFLAITAAIIWWEHSMVSPTRLDNLRIAFALNGPVAILLLLGTLFGL